MEDSRHSEENQVQPGVYRSNDKNTDLMDLVFSNPVVWRILGQFLNFEDLKACRQVSRCLNRQVMDSTSFKNRATVKLRLKDLTPFNFGTTREKWRKLRLDGVGHENVSLCLADLKWLCPVMEEVESLFLTVQYDLERPLKMTIPQYVEMVLNAPKALRCLGLDPELLTLTGGGDLFRSCRHVLNGIRELEFTSSIGSPAFDMLYEPAVEELVAGVTNIRLFKSSRGGIHSESEEDVHSPNFPQFIKLLQTNCHCLEVLILKGDYLSMDLVFDALILSQRVDFPMLSSLVVSVRNLDPDRLTKFLNRHSSSLRELQLCNFEKFSQLDSVLLWLHDRGQNLRSLKVTTDGVRPSAALLCPALGSLQNLEGFKLNIKGQLLKPRFRLDFEPSTPAQILRRLSNSVRVISLASSRWTLPMVPITSAHFAQLESQRLTVLVLCGRGSGVTDETAEFICRNMKMLQKLQLSHANCTDYGFTGIRPGSTNDSGDAAPSEFSLTDLKGLKSLRLPSCGTVTDLTLRMGIRFLELRELDLRGNAELTTEGCMDVIRQNPSLTEVLINEDLYREIRKVKGYGRLTSRLRRFEYYKIRSEASSDEEYDEEGDLSSLEEEDSEEMSSEEGEEGDEEGLSEEGEEEDGEEEASEDDDEEEEDDDEVHSDEDENIL